jgi:transposase-like protein
MDWEQEVKTHTDRVEAGKLLRYSKQCPCCASKEEFRLHDRRRRTFRLVNGRLILVLFSWILRWRCAACGKRFTDYPPFRLAAQAVRA